jgi:hypothetical protein
VRKDRAKQLMKNMGKCYGEQIERDEVILVLSILLEE